MGVSRKTIMAKMEAEMVKAQANTTDHESFLRHISKVKLLCELLLDESSTSKTSSSQQSEVTAEELAWMMDGTRNVDEKKAIKHDPKSIFDF